MRAMDVFVVPIVAATASIEFVKELIKLGFGHGGSACRSLLTLHTLLVG